MLDAWNHFPHDVNGTVHGLPVAGDRVGAADQDPRPAHRRRPSVPTLPTNNGNPPQPVVRRRGTCEPRVNRASAQRALEPEAGAPAATRSSPDSRTPDRTPPARAPARIASAIASPATSRRWNSATRRVVASSSIARGASTTQRAPRPQQRAAEVLRAVRRRAGAGRPPRRRRHHDQPRRPRSRRCRRSPSTPSLVASGASWSAAPRSRSGSTTPCASR
jgi:hypothetical protein